MHENVTFIAPEAYKELEFWSFYSGWEIKDFFHLLEQTEINLPISINKVDFDSFLCKDSNNNDFTITLKFTLGGFFTFLIDLKYKSFLYEVKNKLDSYQTMEKISPIEIIRRSDDLRFSVKTKISKKSIEKFHTYNGHLDYKINISSDSKNSLYKVINNSDIVDDYLLKKYISKSTMYLMPVLIYTFNLSNDDLREMDITIEALEYGKVVSKVRLNNNVITEARFFYSNIYIDIFRSEKFIFTTNDKSLSLTINGLNKLTEKDYLGILGIDEDLVLKLFECILYRKWVDVDDVRVFPIEEIINILRIERGYYTIKALSKITGISEFFLSRIEEKESKIDFSEEIVTLNTIESALKIPKGSILKLHEASKNMNFKQTLSEILK